MTPESLDTSPVSAYLGTHLYESYCECRLFVIICTCVRLQ